MPSLEFKIVADSDGAMGAVQDLRRALETTSKSADATGKALDGALGGAGKSAQRASGGIQELARSEGSAAKAAGEVASNLGEAAAEANEAAASTAQLTGELGGIEAIAMKAGAAMGAMFAVEQVREFASACLEVRAEFESLEVSFSTLLGSNEKGMQMFKDITAFATSTPMMEKDLAQAAQTLLGFNIEAEKIIPTLKMIGDVSMGDAQKFQSLALSYAQAMSAGKLQGGDWLQMVGQGFNPLAEMARTTGKTMNELKDAMSKGEISAQMLEDSFKSATSEGGKFNGMLAKMSESMAGAKSNMEGAFQKLQGEIGKVLEPVYVEMVNGAYDTLNEISEAFEKAEFKLDPEMFKGFAHAIEDVAIAVGTYKAAELTIAGITAATRTWTMVTEMAAVQIRLAAMEGVTLSKTQAILSMATTRLTAAFKQLMSTIALNPWAVAAAAVATLTFEIYRAKKADEEFAASQEEVIERMADAGAEYTNARDKFIQLKDKWEALTDSLDERKQFITDNKDELESLGIKMGEVADAERIFGEQSPQIIKAFELRAKAAAATALATEAYQKQLKAEANKELLVKEDKFEIQDVGDMVQDIFSQAGVGSFDLEAAARAGRNRRIGNANREINALQQEVDIYKNWAEEYIDEAKQIEEELGTTFENLTNAIVTPPTTPPTTTPKAGNLTADQIKANVDKAKVAVKDAQDDLAKTAEKASKANANAIAEAEVGIIDNAFEQKLEEMKLNHQKAVDNIKQNGEEEKKAYYNAQKKVFEAQESQRIAELGNKAKGQTPKLFNEETMSAEVKSAIEATNREIDKFVEESTKLADETYKKQVEEYQEEAFSGMLKSFGGYAEQRLQKERELANDLKNLRDAQAVAEAEGNTQMVERLKDAIKEREKLQEQQLKSLDFAEFQKDIGLGEMLGAIDGYNTEALDNMAESLRKLIDANDDLSADGLQRIKTLQDALNKIYEARAEKNPIDALNKSLKELDTAKAAQAAAQARMDAANAVKAGGSTLEQLYNEAVQSGKEEAVKAVMDMVTTVRGADGELMKYGDVLKANHAAMAKVSEASKRVKTSIAACNEVWQKQSSTISKATSSLREVGSMFDTLGNKKIAKVIGTINELGESVMQAVNDIKNVVNSATDAMTATAKVGVASLSAVEKASVILTIISTAIQVITKVFSLAKEMHNAKLTEGIDEASDKIDALKQSYEDLQDVANKAFGKDKSSAIAQENANLRKQNELIKQQMKLEEQMKEDDDEREENLKKYQDQIRENEKLIAENKEAMQDAIFGEDIQSAIGKFADAYTNALSNGTSAKKAAKQMVADMIKGMITESMKADIAKPMQNLRNQMEAMYADNIISDDERRQLDQEAERIHKQMSEKFGWADNLLKDKSGDLQGTSSGWATASQESIDELNGRFAQSQQAVQGTFTAMLEGNTLLTAVNGSLALINNGLGSLQELAVTANSHLEEIENYCRRIVAATLPHFANVERQLAQQ